MKRKQLWKKAISMTLALLLTGTMLAGCSGKSGEETPAQTREPGTDESSGSSSADSTDTGKTDNEKVVIGVALLDMTQEFFVHMIEGGNAAAKDMDVEVIWKSADSSLDNQIAIIENFIQQGVDCILVDPYDSAGLIPVCEEAQAAGIPVCSAGNFIDSEAVISNLYNDREDTKIIGELVGNMIGGSGDVAMLYGATGNFVSDERQAGWDEAMKEFPDINCTYYEVGWDISATLKTAQDILASNPDIKAIHCFSDGNVGGLAQAVEQAGMSDKVIISSYDGDKDASQAVADGKYLCTLLTGSKRVGYWNIQVCAKLAKGEEMDQRNYLESYLVVTDEIQAKVEEFGIGYDGMNIVEPARAIELFDDMSAMNK